MIDYGKYKLSTKSLLKTFVATQLDQWSSNAHMEEKLEAYPKLRKEPDITEIGGSQLSRRINDLPTESVQNTIKQLTHSSKGLPGGIGRLNIVDSTEIRLPEQFMTGIYFKRP